MSVCMQDNSKSYEWIFMKFSEEVVSQDQFVTFFGSDPDTLRLFCPYLSPCNAFSME